MWCGVVWCVCVVCFCVMWYVVWCGTSSASMLVCVSVWCVWCGVVWHGVVGFSERAEEFKYLGTTLTNQNSIQEETKNKLKSGYVCHYSVRNLLSSSLISKNLKIKIYGTIILSYSYQITDMNTKSNVFPLHNFASCFVWV